MTMSGLGRKTEDAKFDLESRLRFNMISTMQTRTRRQREILDFIGRFIEGHGYEPSYQMIARHFGLRSKAGIARHIYALERQGALVRRRIQGSFQLEIATTGGDAGSSPEIEWLKLDGPEGNRSVEKDALTVPRFMLGNRAPGDFLAFSVPDNAMAGKGIFENDIAIIEKRRHARDGDCVVAEAGEAGIVIRTCHRHGAEIELRADNPAYSPIFVSPDIAEIHGLFRGLLRSELLSHGTDVQNAD